MRDGGAVMFDRARDPYARQRLGVFVLDDSSTDDVSVRKMARGELCVVESLLFGVDSCDPSARSAGPLSCSRLRSWPLRFRPATWRAWILP